MNEANKFLRNRAHPVTVAPVNEHNFIDNTVSWTMDSCIRASSTLWGSSIQCLRDS